MNSNKNELERLEDIRSFYDQRYYKNVTTNRKPPSNHLRRLAKKLGIQKDFDVLDIACGTGEWLSACKELGAHIYGVDISKKAIEACNGILANGEIPCLSSGVTAFRKQPIRFCYLPRLLETFHQP